MTETDYNAGEYVLIHGDHPYAGCKGVLVYAMGGWYGMDWLVELSLPGAEDGHHVSASAACLMHARRRVPASLDPALPTVPEPPGRAAPREMDTQ